MEIDTAGFNAGSRHVAQIENARSPQVHVEAHQRETEFRRKNADDGVNIAIESEGLADGAGIPREHAGPEFVADQDHLRRAATVLCG
jgi:hypothetical protein